MIKVSECDFFCILIIKYTSTHLCVTVSLLFPQAKQALNALTAHNIRKLTSTYITLSLEDIKTSVGLEDIKQTELFLLKMVTSKEIVARVNQKSGMVTFNSSNNQLLHTDTERIKINETALKKLEMHIKGATNISDKLRDMQQKILTSEEYLSRSSKLFQGGGVSFGKGGMSHPDLAGWGNNESMKDFIGLENN